MLELKIKGRITAPEVFTTASGKKGLKFSIAHEGHEKDEKSERTYIKNTWVDCVLWDNDKIDNTSDNGGGVLVKGADLTVIGFPQVKGFVNKNTGELDMKMTCNVKSFKIND